MSTPILSQPNKNTCIDCGTKISDGATRCKPCKGLAMCKPDSEKNTCIDCGVFVDRKGSRCRACWLKSKESIWTCVHCGIAISRGSTRCKPCKGKAMRKPDRLKSKRCIECGIPISNVSTRCKPCYNKVPRDRKPSKTCIDCGAEITYVSTRCPDCHYKYSLGLPRPRKVTSPVNTCDDCGKVIQRNGIRCRDCKDKLTRKPESYFHELAKEWGFLWVGDIPATSGTATTWECKNGHRFNSTHNSIRYGHGCPSCLDYANGYRTSKEQKVIFDMVGGILNHKVGRYSVDVALQLPTGNIAIEYDCWYWHGSKLDTDERKTKSLLSRGWKVLRIKANEMIPTFDQIQDAIYLLLAGSDYEEIVLPDWGKGKAR